MMTHHMTEEEEEDGGGSVCCCCILVLLLQPRPSITSRVPVPTYSREAECVQGPRLQVMRR
jgi:hypothetical protein